MYLFRTWHHVSSICVIGKGSVAPSDYIDMIIKQQVNVPIRHIVVE